MTCMGLFLSSGCYWVLLTGYATLWNAFKRITAGCSQIEKFALYSGTAKRLYHLD